MVNYNFSDLQGKTVILVGGFGLIGKAISQGFNALGSNLIIADSQINETFITGLIKQSSAKVHYFPSDIGNEHDIDKLISYTRKRYRKIDVFVNCSWPKTFNWMQDVEHMPIKTVEQNLKIHLGGYYNCTQKIALTMKKQRSGSIINFSSIYGSVAPDFSIYQGTDMTSPPPYPLIKGGINMMTKYFASYFGKYNLRVNCISPGGVFNHQNAKFVKNYLAKTPLGRMADPSDLVGPTLFLASDISNYITGQNLIVDGGWTTH